MKKSLVFIMLCLFALQLLAQKDIREESIYFLLTTRFFDGDLTNNRPTEWCSHFPTNPNNGNYAGTDDVTWKGDFKGLIQKLDYIKDMGFTAIWITPVVQNRSPLDYHGYHAWDFTKVDLRLESPGYTFKNLLDSAHAKGIKVFLDVVLNHAGRFGIKGRAEIKYNTDPNQPWGRNFLGQPLQDNPNWQYDGLTPNPLDGKIWSRSNLAKMPPPYNQNLAAFNWPSMESYINTSDAAWYNKSGNGFAQGYDDTTNLFYRALAGDTPDLLTGGDSVRNYLFNAYKTFIDMGIDGMRLDAVKHMPKRDVLYFVDRFRQVNPNLMVFAEVAQKRHELHQIEEINPHWYTWRGQAKNSASSNVAVLDFFAMGTFHLFGKGEAFANVKAAARYDDLYADPSTNVMFLDNHDFGPNNDWNKRYDGDAQNLAAALNFMFFWRGLPCVYYGTEIQFKKGAYADIHSSNDINFSIDKTGRAYFGNEIANAPNHQLYKHIRKLNAIRKAVPALQKGSWRWDGTNHANGVGFVRKLGLSEVAVGLAKDAAVSFTFSGLTNGIYRDAVTGNAVTVSNGSLSFSVQPSSAGVYVLNGPGIIGALGDGFFQSSSSGGGGTAAVTFQPVNPSQGQTLTITYTGSLASQSQVIMHYSWDNWTVGGVQDKAMIKSGNTWTISVTVPMNATINFCGAFHNGNGSWDNNSTQDYKTPLGNGQSDTQPPLVSSLNPSKGATNIGFTQPISIVFSEIISKGNGNVRIYENNTLKYSYPISNSNISISGNTVTIYHGGFASGSNIYVLVDPGVFKDAVNNLFQGITAPGEWYFSTAISNSTAEHILTRITCYPNPFGQTLSISGIPEKTRVAIYDLLGQVVFSSVNMVNNEFVLSTEKLIHGLYLLELLLPDNTVYRMRIQKQ